MTTIEHTTASTAPLAPQALRIDDVPADGHCYTFAGPEGKLLASLLILLDSHLATTRAELFYYDDMLDRPTHDAILRRARNIIGTDYHGNGLNTPLAVTNAHRQATITVDHMNGDPLYKEEPAYPLWKIAAIIVSIFVAVLLIGLVINGLRNRAPVETASNATPVAAVQEADQNAVGTENTGVEVPAGAPEGVDPLSLQENQNGLPASQNADPALAPGVVAVMRQGYNSYVRSQPGADAGTAVGYLEPGDRATIVGGPTWLKGDSDTIVWWYVRTDSGVTGWTPANTSTLRLLEPAP